MGPLPDSRPVGVHRIDLRGAGPIIGGKHNLARDVGGVVAAAQQPTSGGQQAG